MVRLESEMRRRETQGKRNLKWLQRLHLTIKPVGSAGPERIGPAQAGAQMAHSMIFHPANRVIQPGVLEMKPLAQPHTSISRKPAGGQLGAPVMLQEAEIIVPIVRRTFGFLVTRLGRPRR